MPETSGPRGAQAVTSNMYFLAVMEDVAEIRQVNFIICFFFQKFRLHVH